MENRVEVRPQRFLFCALGSYGFVYPLIGLAKELQARGHEIAFVTDLGFAPELEAAGFPRIARSAGGDGPSFTLSIWFQPLAVAIQVKHLEYALQCFNPDVLVTTTLCLGPLLAAEMHHLPVGLLGLTPYLWPTPLRRAPSSEEAQRRAWRFQEMVGYLNGARQLFKLPPVQSDSLHNPLLGQVYMLRSARQLEPLARSLPPQVHFVGPCLWEPESLAGELADWLADAVRSGLPLLYVQHGSTFNLPRFWPALVETLGGQPVRVAVSVARMHGEIGEVPPNFLVRPHLPQAAFLARARAAISSGNSTAVLGALMAGVPSLLIPGGGEQVDLTERCVQQGAALSCTPQGLDGPAFRDALDRVLAGEALRRGAARLQTGLQRLAGFERAAGLVCELAVSRRPVTRQRTGARRPAAAEEQLAHA